MTLCDDFILISQFIYVFSKHNACGFDKEEEEFWGRTLWKYSHFLAFWRVLPISVYCLYGCTQGLVRGCWCIFCRKAMFLFIVWTEVEQSKTYVKAAAKSMLEEEVWNQRALWSKNFCKIPIHAEFSKPFSSMGWIPQNCVDCFPTLCASLVQRNSKAICRIPTYRRFF